MRMCLVCAHSFESGWTCPRCSFAPSERGDGVLVFEDERRDGFEGEFFEELAALEAGNFWFRSRNRLIAWALATYGRADPTVFEVGCGNGFVLAGLREANSGLRAAGGELFAEGLDIARRRLPGIPLYQLDIRRLPFDSEFDVVGAFDVLEHVAEDDLALHEVFRATKPGGILLLTVPQHAWLWSAADEHAHHQRRYAKGALLSQLRAAGFEIVHSTAFIALLLPLLLLARMRRRKVDDSYDPLVELRLDGFVNNALELVTSLELAFTKRRLSWPLGGSLLVVARRPAQ
jgi:SAM-dependent methyltransferase